MWLRLYQVTSKKATKQPWITGVGGSETGWLLRRRGKKIYILKGKAAFTPNPMLIKKNAAFHVYFGFVSSMTDASTFTADYLFGAGSRNCVVSRSPNTNSTQQTT